MSLVDSLSRNALSFSSFSLLSLNTYTHVHMHQKVVLGAGTLTALNWWDTVNVCNVCMNECD